MDDTDRKDMLLW